MALTPPPPPDPTKRKTPVRRVFGRIRVVVGGAPLVFEMTRKGIVVHKLHARRTYTATFTDVAYQAFQHNANEHKPTDSKENKPTATQEDLAQAITTAKVKSRKRRNRVPKPDGSGVPPVSGKVNNAAKKG